LSESRAKGGELRTMPTAMSGCCGFLALYSIIELMSP